MKLYHFPSPNPQKVTFALNELGLDCELVLVDLAKGGQRDPTFLAVNPFGRVPVLVDGDLALPESHAILAYLGEKAGRLWPSSPAGRMRSGGSFSCRNILCRRPVTSRCAFAPR
jgi:glutathione S-transferase